MNRRTFASISLWVVLLGCAGSPPEAARYLLRADASFESGPVEAPVRVGIGPLSVAPYLSESTGIVIETEAGQVRAARQHEWAEPLEAGLRSLLRAELSRALGYEVRGGGGSRAGWDYAVEIHVDRLHATMGGVAVLDAGYGIRAQGGVLTEYRFSGSRSLGRDGYPGVVEAEALLARDLAEAIAESVRERTDAR